VDYALAGGWKALSADARLRLTPKRAEALREADALLAQQRAAKEAARGDRDR
jgi:hypothetical protein